MQIIFSRTIGVRNLTIVTGIKIFITRMLLEKILQLNEINDPNEKITDRTTIDRYSIINLTPALAQSTSTLEYNGKFSVPGYFEAENTIVGFFDPLNALTFD